MEKLTKENANRALSIRNILNPEWGSKRFNYKIQPLNDGTYLSSVGSGCNSTILSEHEFHFWEVISWKEETPEKIEPKIKAIVFFRKNGTPDSRIMETDREHDDLVRHILNENEGAEIVGIMSYEKATAWVSEQLKRGNK
jgi:hypothetical protein